MTTAKKLITGEELFMMPDDGRRYELLDGVLVEMAPTNRSHGRTENRLGYVLTKHAEEGAGGEVLVGEPGFYLQRNPDRVWAPDVCYFVRGRVLPEDAGERGYLDVMPDLVVEVISPNERAGQVRQKIAEWLAAGVRLVWAVYPATRTVVAYRGVNEVRTYGPDDLLDAEPVLPGFACPVARLFA